MGECDTARVPERDQSRATKAVSNLLTVEVEPRRSGRANKGNNSDRWQEILDSAKQNFINPESVAGDTATDAGTVNFDHAAGDAQNQDQDEDQIRCVCGQTEEVEDEDKDFIQCDQCKVWQHNQCVGLPSEVPENEDYFCERCRPDLHQKLLREIANGKFSKAKKLAKPKDGRKRKRTQKAVVNDTEDPYDESQFEEQAEQEFSSPKRHRSVSLSDVSVVTEASEQVQAKARKPSTTRDRSYSNKANVRDREVSKSAKGARDVNSKTGGKSGGAATHSAFVDNVNDIHDIERKKIATALVKLMNDVLILATEREGYVLSDESTIEDRANLLGLQIEFAMFEAHVDVKSKFRQLSFNLKDPKNPLLRKRVFDGVLKPVDLVQMSSEDMANPELKAKTEALREESLKQSVLVQETGPRIRRTHKGEEYVEGPDLITEATDVNAGNVHHKSRNRDESDSPMSIKSPSPSISSSDAGDTVQESVSPQPPTRERSGSNFDIKNVWNHIESPAPSESPAARNVRHGSTSVIPEDNETNDEDLLGLLDGDDQVEPSRYDYTSTSPIWHGQLLMQSVADLKAKAILLGGPKTFEIDWKESLTSIVQVDGRIPKPDAAKYLGHQRYSQSKNVFVLQLQAADGKESSLKALFNYFIKKDRYGVIKTGKTRIRDAYIVPLPADADIPDFVSMLPSFNLPADRTDMLLALLVVEKAAPKKETPEIPAQPDKAIAPTTATTMKQDEEYRPSSTGLPQQFNQQPFQHFQPPTHQQPQPVPRWQQPSPMQYQHPHQQQPQHMPQHGYPQTHEYNNNNNNNNHGQAQAPQLDQNAQAVLSAFLRAHPEIASNPQVISSPLIMSSLLDEFVRNGGMRRV